MSQLTTNHVSMQELQFIDSYPAYTAILDQEGSILSVNKIWREGKETSGGFFGPEYCTGNYFDKLAVKAESGNDYALKAILGLRQVIDGADEYTITYPVNSGDDKNWFKLTIRHSASDNDFILIFHEDVSELINTSQQLRESQERYKHQFREADMAIIIGTPDGDILDANPAVEMILGYSLQDLQDLHRSDIMDLNDPDFRQALHRRSETGEFQGELTMIHKSGHKVHVDMTSKIYRNESNHLRTLTMFKDITEKKEIAEKLNYERRFTDTAMSSLPGLFIVMGRDGRLVRWNQGLINELGYSIEEKEELNAYDFIVEEDHPKIKKAIETIFETGQDEIELDLVTQHGERKTYKFRGGPFNSKNDNFIVATGIDLTEKLQIEREKNLTYELMKQLFENSPIGIALIDRQNRIEQVNDKFEQMFGFSRNQVTGRNIDDFLIPEDLKNEAVEFSQKTFDGVAVQEETVRLNKNGEQIPVLVGTVPVEVNGDTVAGYGIYVDIRERIELEMKIGELFKKEKRARQEVEKSKLKLEEMFAQSPSGIALLEGEELSIVIANQSFHNLTGKRDLIGNSLEKVLPDLTEQGLTKSIKSVYQSGKPYIADEEKFLLHNGGEDPVEFYLNYICKPLFNESGEVYGIFLETINVTELVHSRKKVQSSLKEKEILLQEVHHRVKNNLAVMTGLLDLQMMDVDDAELNSKLREVQSRIFSIAQIHEAIYQEEEVVRVQFDTYMSNMINSWSHVIDYENTTVTTDLQKVNLNLNQAVSCGLLTNELMNLIEASQNGKPAVVGFGLKQSGDRVEITVENPNLGISDISEIKKGDRFNLKIIQVLLKQLNATYKFENGDTKRIIIQFQKADIKGSSSAFV